MLSVLVQVDKGGYGVSAGDLSAVADELSFRAASPRCPQVTNPPPSQDQEAQGAVCTEQEHQQGRSRPRLTPQVDTGSGCPQVNSGSEVNGLIVLSLSLLGDRRRPRGLQRPGARGRPGRPPSAHVQRLLATVMSKPRTQVCVSLGGLL